VSFDRFCRLAKSDGGCLIEALFSNMENSRGQKVIHFEAIAD